MVIKKIIAEFKFWSSIGNKRGDLALSQKGFEGIISRKINRKISAPIAKLLYNSNQDINPNHITWLSIGIGLSASGFFCVSNGNPLYAVIGGILTQVSSIADGIDGDYARYLSEEKRPLTARSFGEYLDTVTDRIVDVAIIFGMGFYIDYVFPDNLWVFPLTYLTMSLSLLSSYTRHQTIKAFSKHKDIKYYVESKLYLAGRDVRLFTFFLGGILESLCYITPIPKGFPLALSMVIVSFIQIIQIGNRFFELKRNLNSIENSENSQNK